VEVLYWILVIGDLESERYLAGICTSSMGSKVKWNDAAEIKGWDGSDG